MENRIRDLLCDLGVCTQQSIVPFYPKVRDRDDIAVLKCLRSGVILLSRSDHVEQSHYQEGKDFGYWQARDRRAAVESVSVDDRRRYEEFRTVISGKKWMDVGTGAGGILDLLGPAASQTVAVEPQPQARSCLEQLGHAVYPSTESVPDDDFEVVTLFHVLEHLPDPLAALRTVKDKMRSGAKLIVEVPHARDVLISFFDVEAFKAFTFWSEHLVLHTRQSLEAVLDRAGFSRIVVYGCQRYPLANHLHWLARGEPGGHVRWSHLRTATVDRAYADMLARLDVTDTLIAIAENAVGGVDP